MPSPQFFTFFFIGTTIAVTSIHLYLFRTLRSYLSTKKWYTQNFELLLKLIFILGGAPVIVIFFLRYVRMLHLPDLLFQAIFYPFSIWQVGLLFIFFALMIGKFLKHSIRLALLTMKRFPKIRHALQELENTDSFSKFNASRRRFVKTAVYGISGFSFIGSAAGVVDRKGFDVIETNVHLRGLPEGLKETTVGLISDIHAGAFMDKEDIDEYVQTMNGLQPDIIFIPGDFITSVPDEIYPVVESLANMRAKYGIYGCLGNHDFFSHSEDTVVKELENIGIRILRNEHATLEIKGEKLCLIGVDDLSFGGDIGAAMKGADEGLPRILLCHKPYCFEEAAKFNVDVVFSGHTHGGQLVFAKVGDILITPALLASRYIAGKYYSGASTMYVSRGVGTVGIPVRINCPGEITKISLD